MKRQKPEIFIIVTLILISGLAIGQTKMSDYKIR